MSNAGMIDIGLTEEEFNVVDDCVTKAWHTTAMIQQKIDDIEALDIDIIFDFLDKAYRELRKR